MAKKTPIEWCDSTVNGQMGCDGCELWTARNGGSCYAGIDVTKKKGSNSGMPADFAKPELYPYRIIDACKWPDLTGTKRPGKPWLDDKPRMIFLDDYGDTFTKSLDDVGYVANLWGKVCVDRIGPRAQQRGESRLLFAEALDAVSGGGHWLDPFVPMMEASPHIWLVLTKRAARMRRFFEDLGRVPANFWPMVSMTQPGQLGRLRHFRAIGDASTIRGISYEPILEPVDFSEYLLDISWLITGGHSGVDAEETHLAHIDAVVVQCESAGTSVLVKQLGARPVESYPYRGPDWNMLPQDDGDFRIYLKDAKGGDSTEWVAGGLERFPREVPS